MNGRLKYRSPPPVYLNRSTSQHDGFKANLIAQYSFIRTSSYTSNEYRRYLKARKLGHSVSVSAFRGVHPQSAVFRGPSFIPAAILRGQKTLGIHQRFPNRCQGHPFVDLRKRRKGTGYACYIVPVAPFIYHSGHPTFRHYSATLDILQSFPNSEFKMRARTTPHTNSVTRVVKEVLPPAHNTIPE